MAAVAAPMDDATRSRIAYANELRKLVSPPKALLEDGSLNQEFFKPKKVVYMTEKKWGEEEKQLLYKGIEELGIGKWGDMRKKYAPLDKWNELQLRIKASRMMGSQSLARYQDNKYTKLQVDAEYALNRSIGEKTGCWKAGVLVEDDHGSVAAALAELAKEEGQPAAKKAKI